MIIPANKNHQALSPNGIGSALKTKINVNLGTSRDCVDLDMEMEKVNEAVAMGAEAIMDLSLSAIHRSSEKADRRVSGNNRNSSYL